MPSITSPSKAIAGGGENISIVAGGNWSPDTDFILHALQKDDVAGSLDYEALIDDDSTWVDMTDNGATQVRNNVADVPKFPPCPIAGGAQFRIKSTAGAGVTARVWGWVMA